MPDQSVRGSSREHSITAFLGKLAVSVCFFRRVENHGWWALTLFGRPHLKSLQRRHPSGWVHRCAYVCDLFFSPLGVGLSPASSCSASRQLCAAESSHARFSASRQPWTAATACKGHRSRNSLAAQRQQAVFEAAFLSLEDGSYSHLLPVVSGRRAKQVTSWTSCIGSLASAVGSLSTTRSHVVQGKRKRNSCVVNASSLEAIDYTVSFNTDLLNIGCAQAILPARLAAQYECTF